MIILLHKTDTSVVTLPVTDTSVIKLLVTDTSVIKLLVTDTSVVTLPVADTGVVHDIPSGRLVQAPKCLSEQETSTTSPAVLDTTLHLVGLVVVATGGGGVVAVTFIPPAAGITSASDSRVRAAVLVAISSTAGDRWCTQLLTIFQGSIVTSIFTC